MNMKYEKILKQLAEKENVTVKEIENEMQKAINSVGLEYTPKEFIKIVSFFANQRRYII